MLLRNCLLLMCLSAAGGCPLIPQPAPAPNPVVENDDAAASAEAFSRDYATGLADAAKAVADKAEADGYYDLQELVEDWSTQAKAAHQAAQKPLRERMNSISGKDPSVDPEPAQLFRDLETGFRKAAR